VSGALLALPFGFAIGLLLGPVDAGGSILAVPVLVYSWRAGQRRDDRVPARRWHGSACRRRRPRANRPRGGTNGADLRSGRRLRRDRRHGAEQARRRQSDPARVRFASPRRGGRDAAARARIADAGQEALVRPRRARRFGDGRASGLPRGSRRFRHRPGARAAARVPLALAVGTSLLVIALTSGAALAAQLASGSIDWIIASIFTGAAIAGALAGPGWERSSARSASVDSSPFSSSRSPPSSSPRTRLRSSERLWPQVLAARSTTARRRLGGRPRCGGAARRAGSGSVSWRRATTSPARQPGARPPAGGWIDSAERPQRAINQAIIELEFHISPAASSSRPQTAVGTWGTRSSTRCATAGSSVSRCGLSTASSASGMIPPHQRRTS